MGYQLLAGTYASKPSSTAQATQQISQLTAFRTNGYTANVPPMAQNVVADYKPYVDTYRYDTLLHKPAAQTGYQYNPSGYFKISDHAYLPECTLAKPRVCNGRIDVKFSTND